MAPFAAFLLATAVGLGLSVATFFVARRAGLAPIQAQLIDTLQDNATALTSRVGQLESELARERLLRQQLEDKVADLRGTVTDLATENAQLRRRLGLEGRP